MHSLILLVFTVFLHGQDPKVAVKIMPDPDTCMAVGETLKGDMLKEDATVEDVEYACFQVDKHQRA
jgi:hypothetical protein